MTDGLEHVCELCRRRPARTGSAVCEGCWAELRAERPGLELPSSASYCPCGGGDLHHLCGIDQVATW